MPVRSILVLSNGHGEDIIAAALIKNLLAKQEGLWIRVLPIVGEGNAYKDLSVKILGPRKQLPSGGFMRQNLKNFWMDARAGLFGNTREQISVLRKTSKEVDLIICVGDVLLVILAGIFTKKKMIFLPTAKSEYISGHYMIEKRLMRRYATLVLPRDEKTAKVLQESGVSAQFVGNAMMDSFVIQGVDFGTSLESKVVGILPGSREEAYQNMQIILRVIEHLEGLKVEKIDYLVAWANQLSLEQLEREANKLGWTMHFALSVQSGVTATLISPKGVIVRLSRGYFGDVLKRSDIFLGLAGTANEQAVGMGKPLIAFPSNGPQFNEKFVKAQKRLLGDSISVVEPVPEKIAAEVLMILHDPARYETMGQIGQERMGPCGGIDRMSRLILRELAL